MDHQLECQGYAKINDKLWSIHVFELVEAARQTAGWASKTLVTAFDVNYL